MTFALNEFQIPWPDHAAGCTGCAGHACLLAPCPCGFYRAHLSGSDLDWIAFCGLATCFGRVTGPSAKSAIERWNRFAARCAERNEKRDWALGRLALLARNQRREILHQRAKVRETEQSTEKRLIRANEIQKSARVVGEIRLQEAMRLRDENETLKAELQRARMEMIANEVCK